MKTSVIDVRDMLSVLSVLGVEQRVGEVPPIGDAQLIDGRFASGQRTVARALRLGREYVMEGGLSGPVIRSEAVQRARVRVSLDWKRPTLRGELLTSGTQEGSPADMILGATSLVLRRAGAAVSLRHSTITAQRSRARSTALASTDAGGCHRELLAIYVT